MGTVGIDPLELLIDTLHQKIIWNLPEKLLMKLYEPRVY